MPSSDNVALKAIGDKGISIGKFRLAAKGLIVTGSPSYDEWDECGKFLRQAESAVQFWIGDWLNYGERRWGEKYSQAVDELGIDYQTARNYKWVSGAVDLSLRRDNLPFAQHAIVASLPPKEQERWLDKAENEGLSASRLRLQIATQRDNAIVPLERVNGRHHVRAILGDMLEVVPTLGKFDLVIADPPYNVTEIEWDKFSTPDEFISQARCWIGVIKMALANQYNLFWFCSPTFAADTEMVLREMGMPIQSRIIWHRRNMAMGSHARDKFIDTWEMIFHCGNKPLNFPAEWSDAWFDVQTFAVPQTNFTDAKLHPTQKPIELIRRLVTFGSVPGERVLDPFAGSGTTGRACEDRQCVLVEREPEYYALLKDQFGE